MKIEQLSFDRVRVRLSGDDLERMDLNPEKFLTDTGSLNAFIMNILHEIYETTDFNPFSGSITMEAMPDDDGMSIMLTKGNYPTHNRPVTPDEAMKHLAHLLGIGEDRMKKMPKIRSVRAVRDDKVKEVGAFMFSSFDDLCVLLQQIDERTASLCSLYSINNTYALLVPIMTRTLDDIAVAVEFCGSVRRGLAHEHIKEHGKCIAEKEDLISMIHGIKKLNKISKNT